MAEELPELDEAQNENILDNAPQAPGSLLSSNRLLIIIGIVGLPAPSVPSSLAAAALLKSREKRQSPGLVSIKKGNKPARSMDFGTDGHV